MTPWLIFGGALIALLLYTGIAAAVAHQLTTPRRRSPAADPASFGLRCEETWFPARGERVTISAWHLPAPGATRAVIIAHGVGDRRGKEFTVPAHELLAHLVAHGFTVLAIDLRGHGDSSPARMTYGERERNDILGAADWLLGRGYAPGTIGVLGLSMGGVAGIGAAGAEPAIGALVIDSSCADFLAMLREHFRSYSKLPRFFLPGALLIGQFLTGVRLQRLRPAELLRGIARRPVLVIHARGDALVPAAHAQALAEAGSGALWLTDGAQHLGSFAADPQAYCACVGQFFDAALAEAAIPAPGAYLSVALRSQALHAAAAPRAGTRPSNGRKTV